MIKDSIITYLSSLKWFKTSLKSSLWASLVAQWLRIRLLIQGTRVWALVREDPTCRGATKPVRHNYWACVPQLLSLRSRACKPQLLKPTRLEPMLCNKRIHRSEKPAHHNKDPMQPKIKNKNKLKFKKKRVAYIWLLSGYYKKALYVHIKASSPALSFLKEKLRQRELVTCPGKFILIMHKEWSARSILRIGK